MGLSVRRHRILKDIFLSIDIESRYMWEDGTTADDMIPWYDNEPNVPDTEFCITLANKKWYEAPYETLGDFYAYDVKCDGWNMYTLCEKGKLPITFRS